MEPEASESAPHNRPANTNRFDAARAVGADDLTLELARALAHLEDHPDDLAARYSAAHLLERLGHGEVAARIHEISCADFPGNPMVWMERAVFAENAGDLQAALMHLRDALKADPGNLAALEQRARLYRALGHIREAQLTEAALGRAARDLAQAESRKAGAR